MRFGEFLCVLSHLQQLYIVLGLIA